MTALLLLAGLLQPPVSWAQGPGSTSPVSRPTFNADEDEVFRKIEALIESHQFDQADHVLGARVPQGEPAAAWYFRMGKLYFDHQVWSRAANFLEKSLRLEHRNDQAHLLLGLAWRQLHQPEKAEAELQEATRENPRSELDAYMAGHQLLIDEKPEAALGYLYRAVELNPNRADALRAMGMAQARLGNYGLAESYYRRAVEAAGPSRPESAAACADLAFLLLLTHDPAQLREGLKYATQAAGLNPSLGDAHYLVGKALLKLGRVQEAVQELEKAEKLDPDDSKPHFLLVEVSERLGEKDRARSERKAFGRTRQAAHPGGMATGSSWPQSPESLRKSDYTERLK